MDKEWFIVDYTDVDNRVPNPAAPVIRRCGSLEELYGELNKARTEELAIVVYEAKFVLDWS